MYTIGSCIRIEEDHKRLKKKISSFNEDIEACMNIIVSTLNEYRNISDVVLHQSKEFTIYKRRHAIKNPRHSPSDGYRVIYAVSSSGEIVPLYVYWKKEELKKSVIESEIQRRLGI